MIIGVPTEIKSNENRVALTPGGALELVKKGHQVFVQKGAGLGSGFSDEEYKSAGARILPKIEDIYAKAEMVMKVKEPIDKEYKLCRRGQLIFTYFHFASSRELTEAMIERGSVCLAYETVETYDRQLPLLIPMSEVAGRMAVQEGAKFLERPMGGRGVLLGGVPSVPAGRVLILGGGIVGTQAAKMAAGLGAQVTILDVNLTRLRYLSDVMPANVTTMYSSEYNIRREVATHDLIIGAVLIPGAKAPKLITKDMLKLMRPGTVVVDVAVDQGGCFETTKPTTHDKPVYTVNEVIHYCVANMPGAVPYTSTVALTNATLPYALQLANKGWQKACRESRELRLGLNVVEGKVVYAGVAQAFKLSLTTVESILGMNPVEDTTQTKKSVGRPAAATKTAEAPKKKAGRPAKPKAEVAEAAAPKRKAGRPAKPKAEGAEAAAPKRKAGRPAKPKAAVAEGAVAPKKKAGRPAKPKAEGAEAAAPKRKAGRPAKPKAAVAEGAVAPKKKAGRPAKPKAEGAEAAAPKRKAGRPAKPKAAVAEGAVAPKKKAGRPAKPKAEGTEAAAPKKKAGRPAKPKAEGAEAAAPKRKAGRPAAPKAAVAEGAAAPKKKAGRPAKPKAEGAEAAAPKKKAGRPAKPKAEGAEAAAPKRKAGRPAAPKAAVAEGAAAPKKKAGRPAKPKAEGAEAAAPKRKAGRPAAPKATVAEGAAAPKKKAGRPAKPKAEGAEAAAPKRKAGRPAAPKAAVAEGAVAPKKKAGRPAKPKADGAEAAAAPKRKAGRPKKDA